MSPDVDLLHQEAECAALGAFLDQRIYEFNQQVTGYSDARLLAGCIRTAASEVIAGFNGYTWGGSCELTNVWVHEHHRGRGLGTRLLRAAETEAAARGCVLIVIATHSFQAPRFYEHMGYERKHVIHDHPKGHADIVYAKVLRAESARGLPTEHAAAPSASHFV